MYDVDTIHANRVKGVALLRSTELRQGHFRMIDACGCVCANGVLALAVGLNPALEPWDAIEAAYGMTVAETDDIARMNDGHYGRSFTLSEIGDRLAGKWGISD